MSFASKYNKGSKFDVNTEGFEFKKLSDLKLNKVYKVLGFYINKKGKYGDQPVAILEDAFLNLPNHLIDTVSEMLNDSDAIEAINQGKAGLKPVEYQDKDDNTRLSVEWADL